MNSQIIIEHLIKAFSEEVQAFYKYFLSKNFVTGENFKSLEEDFGNFAFDELMHHGSAILKRLAELGASPDQISTLARCQLASDKQCAPVVLENCKVEKIVYEVISSEEAAIDTYNILIRLAKAEEDFVTEKMAKEILEDEENHLRELKDYALSLSQPQPEVVVVEEPEKKEAEIEKAQTSSIYDEWKRKHASKFNNQQ